MIQSDSLLSIYILNRFKVNYIFFKKCCSSIITCCYIVTSGTNSHGKPFGESTDGAKTCFSIILDSYFRIRDELQPWKHCQQRFGSG